MVSRRTFLTTTALTTTSLALSALAPGLLAANTGMNNNADLPGPLIKRAIPSTGEQIPIIGAGTSGSLDVSPTSAEFEQLKRVAKVFFDAGATLWDTSPNYGMSDATLGQLLAEGDWRQRTFLATKIAADSREMAQAQWAESKRRLKTDHVELLQVHNLRDWKTQLAYAHELKDRGETKYVGITHYQDYGLDDMAAIMRSEPLDFIQIHYSVNAPEAADTVLPLAQEKGIAVLINRAFDDGHLFSKVKNSPLPDWAEEAQVTSWAQVFLKFALSHPAVTAVIPATSKLKHQIDNLGAGVGPMLTAQQQTQLIHQFS